MSQHALDIKQLMDLPAFRRFLWRSIQSARIFEPATNGTDGRNLDWIEGRRCLGFEILRDVEQGLPVQHPNSLLTLFQVLREEIQSTSQEKPNVRRTRSDELNTDSIE